MRIFILLASLVALASCSIAEKVNPPEEDLNETQAFQKSYAEQVKSLSKCYDRELEDNPKFKTEITYEAFIQKNGEPKYVKVIASSVANKRFENCVIKSMSKWVFPVHKPPKPYKVTQSLKFEPPEGRI